MKSSWRLFFHCTKLHQTMDFAMTKHVVAKFKKKISTNNGSSQASSNISCVMRGDYLLI
jgi:hypothetical protein